jgi:hypothetical protein
MGVAAGVVRRKPAAALCRVHPEEEESQAGPVR